jgi:hypothetical protein
LELHVIPDQLRDPVLSLVMMLAALGIAQGFLLLVLILTIRQVRRQIRALYRTRCAWEFNMEQTTTYFRALDLLKRSRVETANGQTVEASAARPAGQRLRLG